MLFQFGWRIYAHLHEAKYKFQYRFNKSSMICHNCFDYFDSTRTQIEQSSYLKAQSSHLEYEFWKTTRKHNDIKN